MTKKTLAEEWLERADNDLQYARAGEKETGLHHVTCFLSQQAAEKTLKGLIVFVGEAPPKTHNLGGLLSKVSGHFPELASWQRDIRKLDKYYITARYPDDVRTDFTTEDAKKALEIAEKIFQWAVKIIFSK